MHAFHLWLRLAILGLLASSASASDYALEDVKATLQMSDSEVGQLGTQGIRTTLQLWGACATSRGLRKLAKSTAIERNKLTLWVNACDLMRISGIGPDVARVLMAVGVKNTRKLSRQKAPRLSAKIEKLNAAQHLTENTPSEQHLAAWIGMAKSLPRK